MSSLFDQLGLASSEARVNRFVSSHGLDPQDEIYEAGYWTEGQSNFLRESLAEDGEWAEVVDQLSARLRQPENAPSAAHG